MLGSYGPAEIQVMQATGGDNGDNLTVSAGAAKAGGGGNGASLYLNEGAKDGAGTQGGVVIASSATAKVGFYGSAGTVRPATPTGTDSEKITAIIAILSGWGACA